MEMTHQAVLEFEDIRFIQINPSIVRGLFLERYYFDIDQAEITERLGRHSIEQGRLVLQDIDQGRAEKLFGRMLPGLLTDLKHILHDKPTVYIHRNSGIPLIGTNEFGIVDRGSNTIEIKPLTGCNFQCPFCSVDEGKNDKTHDYVVECDYLIEEAAKIAAIKKHPVEFHIGPQGEPFLYPRFVELVRGLRSIPQCGIVTVVTNGSLLTEKIIDELADAGLSKINLSLNALSQEKANELAGRPYPLEKVLEMVKYCEGKISVILAPTIVPGYNEQEIDGLVQLGKTIEHDYPSTAFQNFLHYKRGRNPSAQRSFEEFFDLLKPHEEKHGVRLTGFDATDFGLHEEPELPKPFRKRQVVTAKIVMPARYPNEVIAAASERCITVMGAEAARLPTGRDIRIRIVRDKHNIFKGVLP